MAAKNTAALTTDNNNNVVNQNTPESITPATLGTNIIQEIIDSMLNPLDTPVVYAGVSMTRAQLATAIAGSTLNDQQQIQITDRIDGFPLLVKAQGVNEISPFGIWIKSGERLGVVMNYTSGFEGETHPFFAVTDAAGILTTATPLKIADGTQGTDKVLVSNANGQTSWKIAANYQSGILNPAANSGAAPLMCGLAGSILPTKTGRVLINISGEFVSDDTATDTLFSIKTGTGAAPTNGAANTGTSQQTVSRRASSATLRIPFSFNAMIILTPLTTYWIDLATINNSSGSVQLFNVSISVIEQ